MYPFIHIYIKHCCIFYNRAMRLLRVFFNGSTNDFFFAFLFHLYIILTIYHFLIICWCWYKSFTFFYISFCFMNNFFKIREKKIYIIFPFCLCAFMLILWSNVVHFKVLTMCIPRSSKSPGTTWITLHTAEPRVDFVPTCYWICVMSHFCYCSTL